MPTMLTLMSSWPAPKWWVASLRKSGTVTTAATLEIAVIVIERAVVAAPEVRQQIRQDAARRGAEQDQPDGEHRVEIERLSDREREERREHQKVEKPDRDAPRLIDHAPEIGERQRHAEAHHDHRERQRQHGGREDRVVHDRDEP